MVHELEELSKKRRKWVEVNRENGFDEGIKRLLTELYPDNAHFVYELLQNAEDAQAQEVRFILHEDRTEFEHDGKKLFSIQDVNAITSIGFSTKRDDNTNIGKFGVGFKAVFAYTNSPQIVSGPFSFQIQEMVVPEELKIPEQTHVDGKTRFFLSFDNPQKSASRAKSEIEKLLRTLDATTLLFLTNIRKIEYLLPDSSLGYIERIALGENRFEIRVQQPEENKPTSVWFLVFDKEVQVNDEETGPSSQKVKKCRIAMAFGIAPIEEQNYRKQTRGIKSENNPAWRVIPMNPGKVCIYFPADKETSNLRFYIHAPFASTVARDSVRDCDGNNALRDHLSVLLAESMHKIRDQGLLNIAFLAVLPNDKDNLSTFYKPFLARLVKEFKEQALVPMKRGGHAAADNIFRGQKALSDLIDDDDLVTLLGDDYCVPMWVANPPQRNQREDNFLSKLDIKEWNDNDTDLANALFKCEDPLRAQWMHKKDNTWHQKFYAYLGDSQSAYLMLMNTKIVKSTDGTYKKGDECFFSTENMPHDEKFPRVAKDVYSIDKEEGKKSFGFLKAIGVREVDESVKIADILRTHYTLEAPFPKNEEHYAHLRQFMQFLDANPGESEIFQKFFIFKIDDKKYTKALPSATYLDDPLEHTNLHAYYELLEDDAKKYPVSIQYKKSGINLQKFGAFAKNIGTQTFLEKNEVNSLLNKLKEGIVCSLSLSYLLWKSLITNEENFDSFLKDSYSYHKGWGRYGIEYTKSSICSYLQTIKWVPQLNQEKTSAYVLPCEAIIEKLPEQFEYKTGWEWLHDIGFGKKIAQQAEIQRQERERQTEEYKRKGEVLKEIGFDSPEEAIEMARLKKEDPEGFRKWKASREQAHAFPSRPVANPERRQERVEEQFSNSPPKKYESRSRSIRVSTPDGDPATWLRNQYTNDDGIMLCQICKTELPFKKRNGEYYFEKKEVLSKGYFSKEYVAQYLALCPLHAAMYEEFIKKDERAMVELKKTIAHTDNCDIPLHLNGVETSIRFVESHIHDLKIIINELD